MEVVNAVNAASYRELIDLESIRTRYEKEIANDQFRDCVLHKNVLLTLAADQTVMMTFFQRSTMIGMYNIIGILINNQKMPGTDHHRGDEQKEQECT